MFDPILGPQTDFGLLVKSKAAYNCRPMSKAVVQQESVTPIRLEWRRFPDFIKARSAMRRQPCIYLQTNGEERILRVGESNDLWNRYLGGTAYAVAAAMHDSGNLFFVAPAPTEPTDRKRVEATLIYELKPPYNNQGKDFPPDASRSVLACGRDSEVPTA